MDEELQGLFTQSVAKAYEANQYQGTLGMRNSDGTYQVQIPSRPGFVYVTIVKGEGETVAEAFSLVQPLAELPVLLQQNRQKEYIVVGVDPSRIMQYFPSLDDIRASGAGVVPHTHTLESGLGFAIDPRLMGPGRVSITGDSFIVDVLPFFYIYNGEIQRSPRLSIDMEPYIPSAGTKVWVTIGYDPATEDPVLTAGDEIPLPALLTDDDLLAIGTTGIPLYGVEIRATDTYIPSLERFADFRLWINDQGGLTLDDTSTVLENINYIEYDGASVTSLGGRKAQVTILTPDGTQGQIDNAFTDPDTADFVTWVNQGGASIDTSQPDRIAMSIPAVAGTNWRLLIDNNGVPSTPFTVTSFLLGFMQSVGNMAVGIGFRNSGTGRMVSFQTLGTSTLRVHYYNSVTSLASAPYALGYEWSINRGAWIRMTDTGTNFEFSVSPDGFSWVLLSTLANNAWLTTGYDEIWWGGQSDSGTIPVRAILRSWAIT